MSNKDYLHGEKFEVVIDQKPLTSMYNTSNQPVSVREDRHRGKLRNLRFKFVDELGKTFLADYGCWYPNPALKDSTGDTDRIWGWSGGPQRMRSAQLTGWRSI